MNYCKEQRNNFLFYSFFKVRNGERMSIKRYLQSLFHEQLLLQKSTSMKTLHSTIILYKDFIIKTQLLLDYIK